MHEVTNESEEIILPMPSITKPGQERLRQRTNLRWNSNLFAKFNRQVNILGRQRSGKAQRIPAPR